MAPRTPVAESANMAPEVRPSKVGRKPRCIAPPALNDIITTPAVATRMATSSVNTTQRQLAEIIAPSRLLRRQHVVHIGITGELPAVAEDVVHHALLVGDAQAGLLHRDLELVRRDELVPLMGAARQPAQDVLRPT